MAEKSHKSRNRSKEKKSNFDLCPVKYVILFLLDQRRVFLSRKKEKEKERGRRKRDDLSEEALAEWSWVG